MPLDAVALGAITRELDELLCDYRIEKIHQPEKDEIILHIKGMTGAKRLVISANSANARIHLVDETKQNPDSPPMFCMLMRKYFTGAKIKSVKRIGYERICEITLECRNELGDTVERRIICEIMGRNSNIIMLNEEGRIIDSVKRVDITVSSVRNILPGLKYILPPSGERLNPVEAAENDYYCLLKNAGEGREAARVITEGVMGISPLLAAECVFRACGDGNILIGEMSENAIQKTAIKLAEMFEKAENGELSPCVLMKDGGKTAADFAPFIITQYGETRSAIVKKTVNEAAEQFYMLRDRQVRIHDRSAAVVRVINNNLKRTRKKIDILQGEISEAADREKFRIYGELITANLYQINKGDASVKVINYYDEEQKEIEIPLDITKSPAENSSRYFAKYKKAKNTEIYAREQLKKALDETEYLESVLYCVQSAQSVEELAEIRAELEAAGYIRSEHKKKKKKQTNSVSEPMEFEYKGYTIYVGKNNIQNDYLTLKMGRSRDLWLHTKNIPGSHTLIKYAGEDFPDDVIETAAKLAAYFSKAKNAPKAEVDYCPVSHVKKPSGAKPGMVIYEVYNTAFVEPDENLAEKLRK